MIRARMAMQGKVSYMGHGDMVTSRGGAGSRPASDEPRAGSRPLSTGSRPRGGRGAAGGPSPRGLAERPSVQSNVSEIPDEGARAKDVKTLPERDTTQSISVLDGTTSSVLVNSFVNHGASSSGRSGPEDAGGAGSGTNTEETQFKNDAGDDPE